MAMVPEQPLVGSNFYEQARGVLVGAFGCSVEQAAMLISDVSSSAGISPRDLVVRLIEVDTRSAALQEIEATR
jgi:hypothetical protein